MKVIQAGHHYQLSDASNPSGSYPQEIKFMKGKDENYPGHAGATNEEVIEVLIDRITVQNAQVHSKFNDTALTHLKQALAALESRQTTVVATKAAAADPSK